MFDVLNKFSNEFLTQPVSNLLVFSEISGKKLTLTANQKWGHFFLMVETVETFDGCEQCPGQSLECTNLYG